MVVQGNGFHRLVLHVHVPDFHCEVVARHKEASVFRISMKYNKLEQRKVKSENNPRLYKERIPAKRQIDVVRKKKANTTNTTKTHSTYVTSEIELRMSAMKDLLPLAPSRWVSW